MNHSPVLFSGSRLLLLVLALLAFLPGTPAPVFAAGSICGKGVSDPQKPIPIPAPKGGLQQGTFAFDVIVLQACGSNTLYLVPRGGISEGKYYRIYDPVITATTPQERESLVTPVAFKITSWSRVEPIASCAECRSSPSSVSSSANIINLHTQMCLTAPTNPSAENISVFQETCHGASNQAWRLVPVGSGYYQVIAEHSGKCLDVEFKHSEENYDLVQATCDGGGSQAWRLQPFGNYADLIAHSSGDKHGVHPAIFGGAYYQFIAQHSGLCMDLNGWSHDDQRREQSIIYYRCAPNDNDNQLWAFTGSLASEPPAVEEPAPVVPPPAEPRPVEPEPIVPPVVEPPRPEPPPAPAQPAVQPPPIVQPKAPAVEPVAADGDLVLVEPVTLSSTYVRPGDTVTARFRIRNASGRSIVIRRLLAGARGPGGASQGWAGNNVDFPAVTDFSLEANKEYQYEQARTFSQSGDYFAEPVFYTAKGEWVGIPQFHRETFNVVPTSACATNSPFSFPMDGNMGWVYRDPDSKVKDLSKCSDSEDYCHSGLDIYPSDNAVLVTAPYAGVVYPVGANSIGIRHDELGIRTYYAHVVPNEAIGRVEKGTPIATLQNLGRDTHLHFSIGCLACDDQGSVGLQNGSLNYDPSPYLGIDADYRSGARNEKYTKPIGGYCYPTVPGSAEISAPSDMATVQSPVTLRWQPVPGATRYQVQVLRFKGPTKAINYRNDLKTTGSANVFSNATDKTSIDFPTDSPGLYTWHVQAVDKDGRGIWSASRIFWAEVPNLMLASAENGTVRQGEKSVAAANVSLGQERLRLDLRWTGAVAQSQDHPLRQIALLQKEFLSTIPPLDPAGTILDMVIFDPTGNRVDEAYPGARWNRQPGLLQLVVDRPGPGTWQIAVVGKQVVEESAPYELLVLGSQTTLNSTGLPTVQGGGGSALFILVILAGVALPVSALVLQRRRQRLKGHKPTRRAWLYPTSGDRQGIQLFDGLTIGRGSSCHLHIPDADVSRQHAIIRMSHGTCYIQCQSASGIWVNGRLVQASALHVHDTVRIGSQEFVFGEDRVG